MFFLYYLGDALVPLALSFFLAYVLHPVITRLRVWGVPRWVAINGTFLLAFFALTAICIVLGPMLIHLIVSIGLDFPHILTQFFERLEQFSQLHHLPFHFRAEDILTEMRQMVSGFSIHTVASFTGLIQKTFFNVVVIALWILKLFIFPVFFYYSLQNFEQMAVEFLGFFPPRFRGHLQSFSDVLNRVLGGYIRGQLLVCTMLAIFYGGSFWWAGMKYGPLIGIVTGYGYLVPYVGFSISVLVGVVMTLANFVSWTHFFLIIAIYGVGQMMESFVLTPRITGNRVGLDPFLTIVVLIVGGNCLGFFGILIAIPVGGILKHYYAKFKEKYQCSDFYLANKCSKP